MKFEDYKYIRPDLDQFNKDIYRLMEDFKAAESFELAYDKFLEINKIKNNIETMSNLVSIRHSIDTEDEFYSDEQEFFDHNLPRISETFSDLNKLYLESKYRDQLEAKLGQQYFTMAELELKVFDPKIVDLLIEENQLVSKYSKLLASAKIPFRGEDRTLSQLGPFMADRDRQTRIEANKAYFSFFEENEGVIDDIYDRMVKVRTRIAKELAYDNFVQLAYYRLGRSDYTSKEVANYRNQIYQEIVPIASQLFKRQKERLGLDHLYFYDENLKFLTGNPLPKGDSDFIIEAGRKMYSELSPETEEFFNFMLDKNLMDLLSKKGKMGGGYCNYLEDFKSPFIFANFNGTSGDVDVLTHEAGHAFQAYMSRDFILSDYRFPTYEAAEIHSMSMEFLTYPWMENFFKEDTGKYKFIHLANAIQFLPYGVAVDEFQHFVYENPDISPKDRRAKWREIERKYIPERDYGDLDFLNRGGLFFRQGHIFSAPFYYIDYTLAQLLAFQFYNKSKENREEAWKDYLNLCKLGGSKSFLDLVKAANLESPFEDGVVRRTIEPLKDELNSVDDKNL